MSMPGEMPGPVGETASADGGDMSAPMDMAAACESAVVDAMAQREAECRKVGM
jgi:hypothetical protein